MGARHSDVVTQTQREQNSNKQGKCEYRLGTILKCFSSFNNILTQIQEPAVCEHLELVNIKCLSDR